MAMHIADMAAAHGHGSGPSPTPGSDAAPNSNGDAANTTGASGARARSDTSRDDSARRSGGARTPEIGTSSRRESPSPAPSGSADAEDGRESHRRRGSSDGGVAASGVSAGAGTGAPTVVGSVGGDVSPNSGGSGGSGGRTAVSGGGGGVSSRASTGSHGSHGSRGGHSRGDVSVGNPPAVPARRPSQALRQPPPAGNAQVLSPRTAEFKNEGSRLLHSLFQLARSEQICDDFGCGYDGSLLQHGRLFFTQNYICFYSSLFGSDVKRVMPLSDVASVKKTTKAFVIPALEIHMKDGSVVSFSHFFAGSFGTCFRVATRLLAEYKARGSPPVAAVGGRRRSSSSGHNGEVEAAARHHRHHLHHSHHHGGHGSSNGSSNGSSSHRGVGDDNDRARSPATMRQRRSTSPVVLTPELPPRSARPRSRTRHDDGRYGGIGGANGGVRDGPATAPRARRRDRSSSELGASSHGRMRSASADTWESLDVGSPPRDSSGRASRNSGRHSAGRASPVVVDATPGGAGSGTSDAAGGSADAANASGGGGGDGSDGAGDSASGGGKAAGVTRSTAGDSQSGDEDVDALRPVPPDDLEATFAKWTPLDEAILPITPEQFFAFFLADSARVSFLDFHREAGHSELTVTPWAPQEKEGPGLGRSISFRTPLPPNMFGPTSTRATKVQRVVWYRGNIIQLDSSTVSHDVPYGDHFTTDDHWLIEPLPADDPRGTGIRIRIAMQVTFLKSTIFRSKIRTEASKGTTAFDKTIIPRCRRFLDENPDALLPDGGASAAANASGTAGASAGASAGAGAGAGAGSSSSSRDRGRKSSLVSVDMASRLTHDELLVAYGALWQAHTRLSKRYRYVAHRRRSDSNTGGSSPATGGRGASSRTVGKAPSPPVAPPQAATSVHWRRFRALVNVVAVVIFIIVAARWVLPLVYSSTPAAPATPSTVPTLGAGGGSVAGGGGDGGDGGGVVSLAGQLAGFLDEGEPPTDGSAALPCGGDGGAVCSFDGPGAGAGAGAGAALSPAQLRQLAALIDQRVTNALAGWGAAGGSGPGPGSSGSPSE